NKSADLISRINKAKMQPIGRTDVPPSLERALGRAMSRKPENRQGSILELIHELQSVETELGLPQTAVEVAMDEWARATVSDLEDRTRVRGASAAAAAPAGRNRRRRAPANGPTHASVGTVIK